MEYFIFPPQLLQRGIRAVAKPHQEENLGGNCPLIKCDGFFRAPVEIQGGMNVHEVNYTLSCLAV